MQKLTRRQARENAFIALFAVSFGADIDEHVQHTRAEEDPAAVDAFGEGLLKLYAANAAAVDAEIESRLKGWKVQRLSKVNLALLRLAVAEMMYSGEDVDSIVINEAVELAKRFGDESDYQFVNGLLGAVSRALHGEAAEGTADGPAPAENDGQG